MVRKRHFKTKYSCDPQPELKYVGNGFKKIGISLTIQTDLIKDFSAVKILPLKPELSARTVLVWKKNIPMNVATEKFIEFLRK